MSRLPEGGVRPKLLALFDRWEARDLAPLASLAAMIVFFSLASPTFLRPNTLVQILRQNSGLAIVSAGLTFVLIAAEIDLSVGMVGLWAASLCGWMFQKLMAPAAATGPAGLAEPPQPSSAPELWTVVAAAIVVPMLICLAMGVASGLLTVWSRLPSFIITLAVMFIGEGASRYLLRGESLKMPGLLKSLGNEGLTRADTVWVPYGAILSAVVMLAGHVVLQHTRFGRYVYMTGGNREAARLAGVRTGRIVVACLAISAISAALGGLLGAGRISTITADQNKDLLLNAVACVVLGGTSLFGGEGSMGKTLVGVLTFATLTVGLMQIDWIDEFARQLLTGIVLLAALVINGTLAKRS